MYMYMYICTCMCVHTYLGGQIDEPWDYIKQNGAVSGGQYQGTGPFGKGLCSDFSLPHCHHHGPQVIFYIRIYTYICICTYV